MLEYEAKEGDIIFIPPLLLHSISIRDCDEFYSKRMYSISILGGNNTDICFSRYLTPLINHEFAMPYLIAPKHPAYSSLLQMLHAHNKAYSSQEFGYELALKAFLLQAIFLLLQYSEKNADFGVNTSSDKLKNVLDYIEVHYAESIRGFRACRAFAISVNTTSCVSSKTHEHDLRAVYQQCAS